MRFIKKLVILTGGGARGTLMLEKNSYGVWGRLNLFDFRLSGNFKLVILSDDDMFVMRLNSDILNTTFEIGELRLDAVHAAIVGESVELYGSNCAEKLDPSVIKERLRRQEKLLKENEERYIKYSGRSGDYFKDIAPPIYNDFAISDKNYFPAYMKVIEADEESDNTDPYKRDDPFELRIEPSFLGRKELDSVKAEKSEKPDPPTFGGSMDKKDSEKTDKETYMQKTKPTPHELEYHYIKLIEAAATVCDRQTDFAEEKKASHSEAPSLHKSESKLTPAEKPEVIAMARRITLRDYRVEGTNKSGRKATYFERSSEQLKKLLDSNERFSPIERLIPGSKFVKINYDGQRYYLVGVIGSDYICYGVPAAYSEVPPEPLNGYARWLPCDVSKPKGEGFWMMYQDGVSGETLKS